MIDLFLVFGFGFFIGAGLGLVAGMWQREQNELEKFKGVT